ncbi:LysR family transcriptional regulator [Nocardia terrae]|nr:LysR family transcriptional regulator [Nocardia terrae]
MDIRTLGYFVAVAETASFTRAAERCHVAQPSLSQQIQGLERELGEALFERRPRQVRLTAAGYALLPHARAALAAVAAAKDEFAYRAGSLTGEMRIGLVDGIDTNATARVLTDFATAHPDVVLTILGGTSTELGARVSERQLDAAVIAIPVDGLPGHLSHRVVHREEIVTLEKRTDADLLPDRRPVSELAGAAIITYNETSGVLPHITRYLDDHGATTRTICATNDPALHRALARQGLGVAITAASDHGLSSGDDLTVRGFDPPLDLAKVLVWHRHVRSRALSAFLAHWDRFDSRL